MKDLLIHPRPFSLPEYSRAFEKFVRESVKHFMEAKDQLWAMMPKGDPIPAIPIMQSTMQSGQIVQNNPFVISAAFEFRLQDFRSCNIEELMVQIESLAEQYLSVVMPQLFDLIARTCEAAGTSVNDGGRPVNFELFYEGLQKIHIAFDREGKPELPVLVVNPEMAQIIRALPPLTPEQQKLVDDLIERKRNEFNARKRHRELR